ncbi:rhamnulokinase family protein [Dysgonomonas sp. ZJ709]|uniref:rhamnulokinase n=1 Tax=Dysgonomonas sp. ZJ709 TaxID=2709797 RepID=UPI0013E9BCBE|nr:rhamnulokinase family protein [Dysgonomonas sp. ZJ709]
MKTHYFFAFDLGATSGRSILATVGGGKITLKELTRFPNKIISVHGKCYWDIYAIFEALKDGLKVVAAEKIKLDAIGIDTWGVDFVYLGEDGSLLNLPRSYRDPYTNGIPEELFKVLPRKDLYELTGIQIMNFNSLFQLYAAKLENSPALEKAHDILFIPDALSYMLTGGKVCEYTIASTSQLLNPKTRRIEPELLDILGLNSNVFRPIIMPGETIGFLTEDIARECGVHKAPVIAVGGHDTASAVAAVPADGESFAYLSSGTWSLMGIEVKEPILTQDSYEMNFTNEGGVDGSIRFLKNIAGMWLLEQCRKEWGGTGVHYSYNEIVELSDSVAGFQSFVDPDDASFANPVSMVVAIAAFCEKTGQNVPKTHAEFVRCIFDSLAFKYRYVLECLQKMAPFNIEKLHIIGGGSQNKLLNQLTANSINMQVVAGPAEATAIGNVMMQSKGIGMFDSLQEMRLMVRNSIDLDTFYPQDVHLWDSEYNKFLNIIQKK